MVDCDSEWKTTALKCRQAEPSLTYREIAKKCSVDVEKLKRFLKSKTAQSALAGNGECGMPPAAPALATCGSEWREEGDLCLKKDQFAKALQFYEKAIAANENCVLSLSSACEASLRLTQYAKAESFAARALALDGNHEKTWGRYVRSLAALHRTGEAFVWLADTFGKAFSDGDLDVTELDRLRQLRIDLFDIATNASPFIYHFAKGLYVEREAASSGGGFLVRTAMAIKSGTPLSKEKAFLPWTSDNFHNDQFLKKFLDNVTASDIQKTNGLFPRSYSELELPLQSVRSLAELEPRVRGHFEQKGGSLPSEEQIKEYVRALACAKLCSHDDGLHHFTPFYNHSCAPNCEIQGHRNMEIYANRDIDAGEELCKSYLGTLNDHCYQLDWPVMLRSRSFEKSWGVKCACSRCMDEMASDPHANAGTEELWMAFQRATKNILDDGARQFTFLNDESLGQNPLSADWEKVPWKELFFLTLFERRVTRHLKSSSFFADGGQSACKSMQEWGVGHKMLRIIELRKAYVNIGSWANLFPYHLLWTCLMVHARAGSIWSDFGLHSAEDLKKKISEVEDLIVGANGGHMIGR